MTSRFKPMSGLVPATYQGSWALSAQAEKVCSSHQSTHLSANQVGPSNLAVLRLDGWDPHEQRLRQPPNLANLHASAHMRTCARIRVRRVIASIPLIHKTLKQVGLVGRLAKPASMRVSDVQPVVQPFSGWVVITFWRMNMAKVESLRDQMPVVSALVDRFRVTFGAANINAVIRAGIHGEPVFYASENGHTLGTNWPDPTPVDMGKETARERHYREAKENYQALMAGGPAVQTSTHNVVPKGKRK